MVKGAPLKNAHQPGNGTVCVFITALPLSSCVTSAMSHHFLGPIVPIGSLNSLAQVHGLDLSHLSFED